MGQKVTALRVQKGRRRRVNVFLEGEFAFSLHPMVAAKLARGQELDEEAIAKLKEEDRLESAYENALHYLSFRPRSEHEISRHLLEKGYTPDEAAQVLERLRRVHLVDDREFAQFWVENRERFRPRGPWVLRAELRQKGIAAPIIEEVLRSLDEETSALRAAEQAMRRYRHLDEATFRRRMLGFLQRRGFSYGVARQVTEQCWRKGAADLQE
ncbi:MAG: RecX family transcriptional regulator [Anaerolineae bacterium]|nr:RecX family transcriptional regulator [Anaerolineae bacterium]